MHLQERGAGNGLNQHFYTAHLCIVFVFISQRGIGKLVNSTFSECYLSKICQFISMYNDMGLDPGVFYLFLLCYVKVNRRIL